MNNQFDIGNLKEQNKRNLISKIEEKIKHLSKSYPLKKLVAEGSRPAYDGVNGYRTYLVRCTQKPRSANQILVVGRDEWCYCGCEAGESEIIAFDFGENNPILSLKSRIKKAPYSISSYREYLCSDNEEDLFIKSKLFEIEARKSTTPGGCAWTFGEISGISVPYDKAQGLISLFNL